MIKIEGLKKKFNNIEVLKNINLNVKTGEVVVILGPSGSDKSTFLRCLNYLKSPDEDKITIDDVSLDTNKINKNQIHLLRKQSAMFFQHYNLFNNKTWCN